MTMFELLAEGTRALIQSGDPDAEHDARLLLLAAFDLDMAHFLLDRMRELPHDGSARGRVARYREMVARRGRHLPLQQIVGSQDFMGLAFYVDEHVLVPRQDTESLVELVLERQRGTDKRILDLCTGSGCIAVSLAVLGGYRSVTATDISEEALSVARRNAKALLPDGGQAIEFCQGDLFDALEGRPVDGDGPARIFDVITANPPYIPTGVIQTLAPEVRDHEPRLALDGAADGLAYYRRIAAEAGNHLCAGGAVYLEIGYDQGEAVSGLLRGAGFGQVRVDKDLAGNDRVVSAVWPGRMAFGRRLM